MRLIVNVALAFFFAASVLANLALRRDPSRPNIDIFPDMAEPVAYASFSPNPVLPGGKTLQAPVPGTLPRGFERPQYGPGPDEAARAAKELQNPLEVKTARARGEFVYQNFCTPCHGPAMRGDGPVALHGYPAPPNLKSGKSLEIAEGQMFHIVTFGQKNMPAHASQLSTRDRWSVVAYVRAAQEEARVATAAPMPIPEASK